MTVTNDDDLRQLAEARVRAKEGFRIHLAVYVAVNVLLWVIWAYNGANIGAAWPIFVTAGWGIAIVAHWWAVYGHSEERREAQIQTEMEKLRKRGA